MITINSTVPAQMTICGPAKVFTITIYNPSPFLLSNDTLRLTLPSGISYQASSVTGTGVSEFNISVPNKPVFLLPNIPLLATLTISFTAAAGCDVMAFISGGGTIQNNIHIDYTANGTHNYDVHTTSSYIIRQPNLSITTITNQSYTGHIGDVFTRCITVINGGFGELSHFTLTDVHGSGIQITAVNKGTLTNSGTTETIVLNGADFAGIGNGNNLFENGESITICETVHVISCISVASAFEAYWGCNGQHCQSSVSNGNVVFPNLIPNLVITPTPSMNSCLALASPQQLRIVNTGLGQAVNVSLDVFQCGGAGSGYQNNLGSYIDQSSFTLQTGIHGAPGSITPVSTVATASLACMTTPMGKVSLNIPSINAGDTVYIKWNSYSCCYNSCTGVGFYDMNGWRYRGTYSNICQSNYVIAETWGRVYSRLRAGLVNNGSPSTLNGGETGTFDFLYSYYENSYPVGPGAYWKYEFTLPPCLSYSGNVKLMRSNGVDSLLPTSVDTVGNLVTAIFSGAAPWNLTQAEIKIDLTVNCPADCAHLCGSGAVSIKAFYIPNDTCACAIGVSCQTTSISFNCPCPCVGMKFRYFEMKRTSYGLPDNEANGGNGLPDNTGSLDFSRIKTDRVMFGDTITASFNGTVGISLAHPDWQYCFARSSISNGNRLTFVDASLTIYRLGAVIASCTDFTTPGNPIVDNSSPPTRVFKYNLSVASHPGLTGYTYMDGDSVVFNPRYRVTSNIGNATPLNCYSSNYYYMSDIANPDLDTAPNADSHKFQCGNYNGSCSIIGYYYTNCCNDNYAVKSCNDVVISQNYYLSIGPCCNNYAGGDLFPFEYRNWAHIKILTAIVPYGYDFISARFNQVRTAGTLITNTSSWDTITPVNANSDTLTFPVEKYFQGYGGTDPPPAGTIPLSDDGFHGTLQVTIRPSCKVTPTISQAIRDTWTFAPTSYLSGPGSASTTVSALNDSIVYQAPDLFLQSTLPSVLAPNNTTSWDISISNTSNVSNALNTWLSGPVVSGVSIINIVDLGTSLPIIPVGSIFQIGTVNAGAVRNFRITAAFTSCAQDSIFVYSGWNCNAGYPDSVSTYPCTPKKILLKLTPLMPALVVDITAPSGTIQLCDTASYSAHGVNVQLGTAYNDVLTSILPVGVSIVPGSVRFRYPASSPYVVFPDPVFAGGTTWTWGISAIDSTIHNNGLKGILEPALNSFDLTFKVITNCGYTSGSAISFDLTGLAACGQATGQDVNLSSALGITGAATPYHTAIKLLTTYISPCANNSVMNVSILNQGPDAFSIADSVTILLPAGVSFINGTFAGQHNPPVNGIPRQVTLNGRIYLTWKLPASIAVGDSTVFSFGYKGDPHALSCDITEFEAQTTSSTNVTCVQSGTNCGINIATGDTTLSVFTYKAYLSLSNGTAVSVPNPPGGETVTVNLNITNTGQAILSGANSIIQFYYDANGNGIYNPGDIFLARDTLLITNNSTTPYSNTFNVTAGHACSIIAIIDTAVNPCVCNPSQLIVHPPLITPSHDTTVCSGQTVMLNTSPPITGYTYSWTPVPGLSSALIADPVLTTSNLTALPVLTSYILSTSRMGCISKDTVKITVNPIPVSNAGTDIVSCPSVTPGNIGTASVAGYAYLWSPAAGLSSTAVSNPTALLTPPGTVTYKVTTTSLGCVSSDSVVVRVNPFPLSNAGTDIVSCVSNTPGILGMASTAGYSYHWSPALYLSDTTVSNPAVTLINPRITSYIVTTSALGCVTKDTVAVRVNPIPVSDAGTDILSCSTITPGSIGTASIPGYTYLWSPVTGLSNAVVSNPAVSLTVSGTIIYTVTTTALNCSSSDNVSVQVNPLPTAVITGTTAVCNGTQAPVIAITGAGSTAPYTFTYTLNAGANQTITSTGNIAVIPSPTAVSGTFTYTLVSVLDASSTACSQLQNSNAVITVNPLPTAVITGTATVCQNDTPPNIIFRGASGTAPYTFTYKINNGANQTITSIVDSITLPAPTSTPGTFTYSLLSVQDASSTACLQTQTGSAVVTVNPLPTAVITGTTAVCKNAPAPNITFTGASGTAPYTFTYTINNGTQQTVASIGNSITITAPDTASGTFIYALVSVQDASPTACFQTQGGSAVITVNPLPTAVMTGTVSVCKNDIPPNITFTGASGTAPYTFIYKINGGADQTVISIGNSITVSAPANTTGAFIYSLVSVKDASSTACLQTQTGSDTVTVNPLPIADFSFANVCLNQAMNFSDLSTVTPGSITGWSWNFGDSSPLNTAASPSDIYANPGTYSVSLICTTSRGCKDTALKSAVVHPLPHAQFNTMPVAIGICDGTTVNFYDASTILIPDNINSWRWNFGDNSLINFNQNTSHLYGSPHSYFVHLWVVSNFGCRDSITKPITINPNPIVDFSVNDTAGCVPLCVVFTDLSTIAAGGTNAQWWWNFGDGSSNSEPVHCYTNDSIYAPVAALTVTSDSGCVTTLSKNNLITVYPNPHAAFTADPEITTVVDPIVSLIDLSTGAAFWNWNFGDLTTSAVASPLTHTYPADTATYKITLITSTLNGCKDTAYQTIRIDADFVFYIPNSFTPNGDGINDYFFGKGVGIIKYNLWIFDRWGNQIFDCSINDVPQSQPCQWDGRANGGQNEAQIDVYVWKVKLTDVFNRVHNYIGKVTIVK